MYKWVKSRNNHTYFPCKDYVQNNLKIDNSLKKNTISIKFDIKYDAMGLRVNRYKNSTVGARPATYLNKYSINYNRI